MSIKTTVARFTTPTSIGQQTWTDTNLKGLTPKAVMIIANHADTDGTAEDSFAAGIGFCTGASNEVSCSISCQHGVGTTNTDSRHQSTSVISLLVDGSAQVTADFVSFQANSVTLDFTAVDTDEQLFTVIFFAGTDLTAHANVIDNIGDVTDNTTDITDPGFEPDLVILASSQLASDGSNANAFWSFGACVNDGSDTQKSFGFHSRNNQGASAIISYMSSQYAGTAVVPTALDYGLEVDAFDSSGFSVITRNAGGNNDDWFYLALNFGNVASANVRSYDSPTTATTDARTGVGFKPGIVILGLTDLQSEDTAVNSGTPFGAIGISCFTANTEFCNSWADEDTSDPTDTQSLSDNQAVNFAGGDGTTLHAATFVSMDSDGHTLSYSTADGTVRKWFEITIEAASELPILRRRREMIGAF